MSEAIRNAFRQQASTCRAMHSPLTAEILETLADILDYNSRIGAHTLDWPGDPMADALKLRIRNAIRSGASPRRVRIALAVAARSGAVSANVPSRSNSTSSMAARLIPVGGRPAGS